MTKVLCPGSYNPITKGHENIIEQAAALFDEVVIAVLINPKKKDGMFSIDERVAMIKEIYQNYNNIKVVSGTGAATDIALLNGCKTIVRGLRSLSDYDYEVQLAQTNKRISDGQINTVCLFADVNYQFISSTMVKEVFYLGKSISDYVDPIVEKQMVLKRRDEGNE